MKLQLKYSTFLNYKPSKIAACAVIIANNICNKQPLTQTGIWNLQYIIKATGYNAEMLWEPL